MLEYAHGRFWHFFYTHTHVHVTVVLLAFKPLDVSSKLCGHAWIHRLTRLSFSTDVSTEAAGRIQSELRLRPSRIWTHPAFVLDALRIFVRRCTASTNSMDASSGVRGLMRNV